MAQVLRDGAVQRLRRLIPINMKCHDNSFGNRRS
jgi:hypothetical protein